MSVPLDSDGFLRRECPTCEREFKWKQAQDDDETTPAPEGGYFFCPYCIVQAPPGSWWTQTQIDAAQATAFRQVVKPELDKLSDSAGSSGFFEVEVSDPEPERPQALEEADDMRLVTFGCHPEEPVKVLDDWERPIHCLICGESATPDPEER
ncbi:MAG TPA: hypothetical protein VND98_07235 [Solirubrobacterales bacterium]|nr:hypothetical protein [Solirubrobacterales bacterium]